MTGSLEEQDDASTPLSDEDEALRQLESFLEPRVEAVKDAGVNKSVEQIFEETHHETQ